MDKLTECFRYLAIFMVHFILWSITLILLELACPAIQFNDMINVVMGIAIVSIITVFFQILIKVFSEYFK